MWSKQPPTASHFQEELDLSDVETSGAEGVMSKFLQKLSGKCLRKKAI